MKGISLFAGIGAEALAMSWAGIEHIVFCEIDPWCQDKLRRHRRIEAMGNCNPPIMYYQIFKAIMEVENEHGYQNH